MKFPRDWITRPVFGLLLAAIAIAATIAGGIAFAVFLAIGAAAAAREWHRLFAPQAFLVPAIVTVVAIGCALAAQILPPVFGKTAAKWLPFAILLVGSSVNFALGRLRLGMPIAHAGGVLYIGIAALSLEMLRASALHPLWLVVIFFTAVWATDTGALVSGKLIGGPKLAPRLSPNKTWAGFIGGTSCGILASVIFAVILSAGILRAALFGAAVALAAHFGDLFESLMKRRSGRKDSGGLIPGHGGVLDRVDSALFAAPLAAILVLALGFDPLMGISP